MDIPSATTRKIHPSEYKLPKVCRKARTYSLFIGGGILALLLVAFVLTLDWLLLNHGSLNASLVFWLTPIIPLFYSLYVELSLTLTDKALIVHFVFRQYVIPWDDVLEIKHENVNIWIFVRDLTLIHRLMGVFKWRWHPGFVLSHALVERYEILKIIEYKLAMES